MSSGIIDLSLIFLEAILPWARVNVSVAVTKVNVRGVSP